MELNENNIKYITEAYGDAFYLLDSKQFEKNYTNLVDAFSSIYPHFNIAYSYKTNYTPKLCQIVNSHGGYAEVVSDMEMEIALRVGVPAQKIIWNGPIKNMTKVRELLLAGGTVNVDNIKEMKAIASIAESSSDHRLNVGVRCNYDVGDGVISRFGFDTESDEFSNALHMILEIPNLHLVNLHCHFAKRSVEFWPARAKGMIEIIDVVSKVLGYVPERIDLGGGIYGNMDDALKQQFSTPIPEYMDYANAAAREFIEHFPNADPELMIEPGSALAGDCMKFVGKVESIKNVRGKYYATILGSQKNISMGGVNPPLMVLKTGEMRQHYENLDIVGYTCIEGDVLFHNYQGELAEGDYIVFGNCGSYSIVMKPPFIMPNFPVLDICGDEIEVIKRGETFDDLFRTFVF